MIPAEAVTAAERAVIQAMIDHGPDGHIDGYQEITRAALGAAAPHILAAAYDERRIAKIEARLKEATPGPWESMTEETPDGENIYYTVSRRGAREHNRLVEIADSAPQGRVDAEFIAHAPEDIAYLLAELKQLRSTP